MVQANMLEAKTDLSKFVRLLETHAEDVVYLARNGKPVVQMTLIPEAPATRILGLAKGEFVVPDNFDAWDSEIEELFGANQ